MSSIRLSGTSSGYYDLTVPAVAGTNSIDLSNLPVKDSSGNLAITGQLGINTTGTGVSGQYGTGITVRRAVPEVHLQRDDGNGNGGVLMDNASSTRRMYVGTYDANSETHIGTNGTQRVIVNASGHMTTPNQPYFFAVSTAQGVSITNSIMPYDTVSSNIGNHFNTSSYTFTAPTAGKYLFTVSALNYPNSSSNGELYFSVNGGSYMALARNNGIGSQKSITGSAIINLSTNDNVTVRGTLWFYANGGHGHFSGMLLG